MCEEVVLGGSFCFKSPLALYRTPSTSSILECKETSYNHQNVSEKRESPESKHLRKARAGSAHRGKV